MKKFTVELIVPDDYSLVDVSDLIQIGCKETIFPKGDTNLLTKLKPEVVTTTPFNASFVTMVLAEIPYNEG